MDCRSEQREILAARFFYIFVPSLGLPKTTARVGSSSSTAEKKAGKNETLVFPSQTFAWETCSLLEVDVAFREHPLPQMQV